MVYIEILQLSFLIALFCVSWDILLTYHPGEPKRSQMLLYWLRRPFVDHEEYINAYITDERKEWAEVINNHLSNDEWELMEDAQKKRDNEITIIEKKLDYQFYLKPILLCKYCFPSFYGTIIFIMLKGFHVELWKEWLLSIICSVIMVGIISGVHEKVTQ